MKPKILITSRSFGSISPKPMSILEDAGFLVTHIGKDFNFETFCQEILESHVLIIGAHQFPVELMEKCSKLKLICKHGAGLDNIPVEAAKKMGIAVCNVPGTNSNAVADLTFGLILSCARHIALGDRRVRENKWGTLIGSDVYGKTLGLLGFGAIAKNVARRGAGFSMPVKFYDPFVTAIPEEFSNVEKYETIQQVIAECDFLSIHLPLTEETKGIISKKELALMRKGSYLINTARGGIVDEQELYNALESGHLAGAAIDVTAVEPIERENPLLLSDKITITPHIGMYSKEALEAVSIICAENAVAAINSQPLKFQL